MSPLNNIEASLIYHRLLLSFDAHILLFHNVGLVGGLVVDVCECNDNIGLLPPVTNLISTVRDDFV